MTVDEYRRHMTGTFEECLEISARKCKDYAGDSDPFANFRMVQHLGVCTVEQGILTRLSDKFSRIANLLGRPEGPAVVDEKVDDTILDAINYLAILRAWLADGR